jgi:hypothetical protein
MSAVIDVSEYSDIIRVSGRSRGDAMNESFIYNTEEEILTYEISDAALEIAAGFTKNMTVSLTIAYCTFDFCNTIGP